MTQPKETGNTQEELARGAAVGLWIRTGLARKGWKVADLQRATGLSKGYLSRITHKNGVNTTTGAYSRPGEDKIDLIAEKMEADANEGRRAAGYADADVSAKPVFHDYPIGEFKGDPIGIIITKKLSQEELDQLRLAVQLIVKDKPID